MNILYATDDKFVPIMGVSITSLFESNKDMGEINVYVLGIDISKENENKLQNLAKQYERQIVFIDASEIDAYLDNVGAKEWGGGRAAWYRCFAGRLLPDDVDRVLYIDCDTIVVDSLEGLEKIDFEEGKALAMTVRFVRLSEAGKHNKCLGLSENDPYYQSGVILYDMKLWREIECEEKLLPIIGKYGKDLPMPDQDAINCALHSLIQTLPMRYHLVIAHYYKAHDKAHDFPIEAQEAIIAPAILHYIGIPRQRPWWADCECAYTKEWRDFKDISPWKDEPLWGDNLIKDNKDNEDKIIQALRRALRFVSPKLEEVVRKIWQKTLYKIPSKIREIRGKIREQKFYDCTSCTKNMPCAVKQNQV